MFKGMILYFDNTLLLPIHHYRTSCFGSYRFIPLMKSSGTK